MSIKKSAVTTYTNSSYTPLDIHTFKWEIHKVTKYVYVVLEYGAILKRRKFVQKVFKTLDKAIEYVTKKDKNMPKKISKHCWASINFDIHKTILV